MSCRPAIPSSKPTDGTTTNCAYVQSIDFSKVAAADIQTKDLLRCHEPWIVQFNQVSINNFSAY